jgi:hypothetical protein
MLLAPFSGSCKVRLLQMVLRIQQVGCRYMFNLPTHSSSPSALLSQIRPQLRPEFELSQGIELQQQKVHWHSPSQKVALQRVPFPKCCPAGPRLLVLRGRPLARFSSLHKSDIGAAGETVLNESEQC